MQITSYINTAVPKREVSPTIKVLQNEIDIKNKEIRNRYNKGIPYYIGKPVYQVPSASQYYYNTPYTAEFSSRVNVPISTVVSDAIDNQFDGGFKAKRFRSDYQNDVPRDAVRSYAALHQKPKVSNEIKVQNTSNKTKNVTTSPQISFKDAFNQARNSGKKEFSWGGKRFNTQKKGEEGFMWSNGRWINPNLKFVAPAPSPTGMTTEEANELNRKAKPINNWEGATFAKNGVKLTSKNPIERFKNRIKN